MCEWIQCKVVSEQVGSGVSGRIGKKWESVEQRLCSRIVAGQPKWLNYSPSNHNSTHWLPFPFTVFQSPRPSSHQGHSLAIII